MLARLIPSLLLILGLALTPAHADELTAEKKADIERLMTMTGAATNGKQMASLFVGNMTRVLKSARPDIPQNVLNVLPGEVMAVIDENTAALNAAMVPVYHKHFSAAEVKDMIAFYSTDLGRKTIRVMPLLMQEAAAIGQRWGETLGPKVEQRVKARLKREGISI